jgi:hypothetical protein
MKRLLVVVLIAALVAVPTAAALNPSQARLLLRVAAKLSGLASKGPVRVVIERPTEFKKHRVQLLERGYPVALQNYDETVYRGLGLLTGAKGTLRKALIERENGTGLYDPTSRTAYVQSGASQRATALHELVHALQDQHFDLRRMARLSNSDARVAATAAIEGHAGLVTEVLPHKTTSASPTDKLTRFLDLERGFAYSVGLRFSSELRNLGGRNALLGSLKQFPATSEQIFHMDKYLERERAIPIVLPVDAAGLKLSGDSSFGELDVRALLAVFDVPRLDTVGSGWGGGRTAVYRGAAGDAVVIALDWDTERDAAEWEEAVATYVNEAFDPNVPGPPPRSACAATSCWLVGDRAVAFQRDGQHTALALSGGLADAALLARTVIQG